MSKREEHQNEKAAVPYYVIVTKGKGLNIVLTNKNAVHEQKYCHFVSLRDAEGFTIDLENALRHGIYTEIENCALCGQPFSRREHISSLTDGRIVHYRCFTREVRAKRMTEADRKERQLKPFPPNLPEYDFTNFQDTGARFKYSIQIVSRKVINLRMKQNCGGPERHTSLTYDECQSMIREIRDATLGKCFFCGYKIYKDDVRYTMKSGEEVHGHCMDFFITSPLAGKVAFPAKRGDIEDRKKDIPNRSGSFFIGDPFYRRIGATGGAEYGNG